MDKKAFFFMLISASCFAVMNVIVKYTVGFSPFQMAFFRSSGSLLISIAVLNVIKQNPWGHNKVLLISRGVVGTTSLILFFAAIQVMPVGSAVSLRYLSPFFGIVLSMFFLKEKVRNIQWLFIVIAFCGAAMIKGFDTRIELGGFGLIMASAFFSGIVYLLVRKLGKSEHPVVVVFYFTLVATILSLIGSIGSWITPEGSQWYGLLSLGILGYFGQYFMTKAFQLEETSKVAPLKYVEAILAMLLAWMILGESSNVYTIIGLGLVIIGILLNSSIKKKKL